MGSSKLGIFLSGARTPGGAGAGGGISEIQEDDATVATNVTILNFEGPGLSVVNEGGGKVTVILGRIVTHELDSQFNQIPNGPLVTVDNNGDVVRSLV